MKICEKLPKLSITLQSFLNFKLFFKKISRTHFQLLLFRVLFTFLENHQAHVNVREIPFSSLKWYYEPEISGLKAFSRKKANACFHSAPRILNNWYCFEWTKKLKNVLTSLFWNEPPHPPPPRALEQNHTPKKCKTYFCGVMNEEKKKEAWKHKSAPYPPEKWWCYMMVFRKY